MASFGPHHNEFDRTWLLWKDYFTIAIFDFPLFMIRIYKWPDKKKSTLVLALLGFTLTFVSTRERTL